MIPFSFWGTEVQRQRHHFSRQIQRSALMKIRNRFMFTVTRIVKTTAANRSAFKIGCWLILLVTLPIASYAQTGPVPEYISSMSTFEVRRLDDSYSPTNGNISMESVTPAEWLNNDPSVLGLDAVVAAWSGGGKS